MKIAICFFGVHPDITNKKNGTTKNLVPYYLKKNVFYINPTINTFVHSWSIDKKNEIIKEYKPTEYIIEKQKKFEISHDLKNIRNNHSENKKNIKAYNLNWVEIHYSMTYSMKKVVSLMSEYERKNNFKYDIVVLSMMDCVWLIPLKLNNIDKTAIYNPIWGRNNEHSIKNNYQSVKSDWVISNSDYIKKFSTLYDNLPRFLKKYRDTSSIHTIFKDQQNTITDNIKYKYNDVQNNPVEADRCRGLVQHNII